MKYVLSALILGFSVSANAENDSNFSIGLGSDHGGIGAKYSINHGKNKYFGSLGLLSYVESSGESIGYGLGWEHLVSPKKNALGVFLGSVDSKHFGKDVAIYQGIAATYNYYFSGFTEKSFVIGASIFSGTTSKNEEFLDKNTSGVNIKLAYQW
ncbi:hypothetical protein [Microbulbifer sp.]|uniref:hypothetical protein n=1 Tax=Microbulbifer sp. TaxID=1908541 RepID=UPI003F3B9E5F